jgi:hypothetical protein
MAPRWRLISTLLSGTMAMRAAGQEYLPQHDAESPANYNERLQRCTLYNMTELTLDSLVGKVFVEPLVFSPETPKKILDLYEDVDLQGNNASVFAREVFRIALAKTVAYVLVDMPAKPTDPVVAAAMSLEDDHALRPYWALIDPENLIFQYAETIRGREVLQQVRIYETVEALDGFALVSTGQIRILRPGAWETWRPSPDDKDVWSLYQSGTYDLDEIPLWAFYANRCGLGEGKPPIEDLAHLNVRHWQSTSDQISILTVARFPMLACSGAASDNGALMKVGPRQLLGIREPNGKFYYVEHTGKAIESGAKDLADLEEKMAAYGAEFLRRKLAGITATEKALDLAETMSTLRDTAHRFADGLARLLDITAKWMRLGVPGGKVKINTEFIERAEDDVDLQILVMAYKDGALTTEGYLLELQRHKVLSADMDVKAMAVAAQKEWADRMTKTLEAKAAAAPVPAPVAAAPATKTDNADSKGGDKAANAGK